MTPPPHSHSQLHEQSSVGERGNERSVVVVLIVVVIDCNHELCFYPLRLIHIHLIIRPHSRITFLPLLFLCSLLLLLVLSVLVLHFLFFFFLSFSSSFPAVSLFCRHQSRAPSR